MLAAEFKKVLEEFGISDKVSIVLFNRCCYLLFLGKILGVTCDNASANDAMLDKLESTLAHFEGALHPTHRQLSHKDPYQAV